MKKILCSIVLMAFYFATPYQSFAAPSWDFRGGHFSNGNDWCELSVFDDCSCVTASMLVDCNGAVSINTYHCPPCYMVVHLQSPNINYVQAADSFSYLIPGSNNHAYDLIGYHQGIAIFRIYDSLASSTDTTFNYATHVTILNTYRVNMKTFGGDQFHITGNSSISSVTLNHDTVYTSGNSNHSDNLIQTSLDWVVTGKRGSSSTITIETPQGIVTSPQMKDQISNFTVSQNNASITAKFNLETSSQVRIEVCDMLGRQLYHSDQMLNAGDCSVVIPKQNTFENYLYCTRKLNKYMFN